MFKKIKLKSELKAKFKKVEGVPSSHQPPSGLHATLGSTCYVLMLFWKARKVGPSLISGDKIAMCNLGLILMKSTDVSQIIYSYNATFKNLKAI